MPAKMFGVETKDDFYAKYIAQGCWTRCLQCQRSAGIGLTSSSDNIKSHFVVSGVLGSCAMIKKRPAAAGSEVCKKPAVNVKGGGPHPDSSQSIEKVEEHRRNAVEKLLLDRQKR